MPLPREVLSMTWDGNCPVCGHYSLELIHDEGKTLCLDCFCGGAISSKIALAVV